MGANFVQMVSARLPSRKWKAKLMATTLSPSLARLLIRRTRIAAVTDAIQNALPTGIIGMTSNVADGQETQMLVRRGGLELSIQQLRKLIGRDYPSSSLEGDDAYWADEAPPTEPQLFAEKPEAERRNIWLRSEPELRRLLCEIAEPMNPTHVATFKLLERGLQRLSVSCREFFKILTQDQPVVAISCEAPEFDEILRHLLETGDLFGKKIKFANGYRVDKPRSSPQFTNHPITDWRVILFHGPKQSSYDTSEIGYALQTGFPVFGLANARAAIPGHLLLAAEIVLDCGPLDFEIINSTANVIAGVELADVFEAGELDGLQLSDLAIAMRPGFSAKRIQGRVRELAEQRRKMRAKDDDLIGKLSEVAKDRRATKVKPTGSEIIMPRQPNERQQLGILTHDLATLSGYGEAREWGMALKDDLDIWKEKRLDWREMMSKVLLYGPPGTGKTTFARALCNTLQVPLVAASVTTWLQPSHLGDVLARMSSVFEEARALAPCILFVDEIDGIGRRQPSGEYVDYWNSVVNRFLELLDGTTKVEGVVIVGATNRPDYIDDALLRSGRLETHIEIPPPNIDALAGIFRTHLATDIENVVRTAGDLYSEETPGASTGQLATTSKNQIGIVEVRPYLARRIDLGEA